MADTRDLKSGGSICPPNLKSPVKSSVFQFSLAGASQNFSPVFPPSSASPFCICRCVGIGRQSRLKICQNFTSVRVRVPSAAPRRRGLRKFATTFYASHEKSSLTRSVAPPLKIVTANTGLRFCFLETLLGKVRINPRWLLCAFEC